MNFVLQNLTGPATFSSWWRYGGATLPAFYGRHTRLWFAVGQGDVELGSRAPREEARERREAAANFPATPRL